MGEEKTPKQQLLMTTLESLGNHLHSQITTRFPQLTYSLVSKITGILLECGEKEVLAMLQNGPKLQMRISQVLRTLYTDQPSHSQITSPQPIDNSVEWTDEDSEKLFDKVATIEPVHCAKITGMLLEGDKNFLRQSLINEDLLKSAICKARLTYLQSIGLISSSACDTEIKEENCLDDKGDAIYSQVTMWFSPKLAEKITGMLLEMPSEELSLTVNNLKVLKNRAEEAYVALKNSGHLTMYESSLEDSVEFE
ncbi:polyadenylate-binding B-like isoform X2 [Octopus vulgaris]|uniref:Polyadenylate-binding B-like isoform X2 n=2 Tax=Octopus TaxID=6643 RepID=A0AA36BQC2_OCTVU|nr:uncharacterized protein LOC115222983 isoform X1 [Octopus sinensis]CAI9738399.1 polyadenylate-binding B-like isoform X2 [Octopus vulgaris]